jgi:hypothetical protein
VALKGEDVFEGSEDRLDRLADRREVRPAAWLVSASGPEDRGVEVADGRGERAIP